MIFFDVINFRRKLPCIINNTLFEFENNLLSTSDMHIIVSEKNSINLIIAYRRLET